MDERTDSGEFYPGGDRRGGDPIDLTFDDAVTRTSARAVKGSGIWAAIWGALEAFPTGFTALYDWVVAQLAGKLNTDGYTSWRISYPVIGYELLSCRWIRRIGVEGGWVVELLNVASGEKETFNVPGAKTITEIVGPSEDPMHPLFSLVREKMCKTKTSELTNDGDGDSPFATVSQIPDISGKADAADLRYALVTPEIVTTYSVPDSWFPISFVGNGTSYTVPLAEKDRTRLLVQDEGAFLECTSDDQGIFVLAFFLDGTLDSLEDVESLQFNGVAPVVGGTALDVTTTATLADRTVNLVTATDETSIDIELPAAVTVDGVRYCRDFILDIDNSANAGDLALEFTALDVDYAFVPLEDDSISEMMTIGAGERVRLYFTETPYITSAVPVINVARVTLGDFVTTTTQGGN